MNNSVVHTLNLTLALAFALATASAFELRVAANESRNPVVPEVEKENRITNGNTAQKGRFPYQVGLLVLNRDNTQVWCGGSLISTKCILTAAHCVDRMQSLIAYLGATNLHDAEVELTVHKNNVVVHFHWNTRFKTNDIALIKIPRVVLSRRIQLVALPAKAAVYHTYAEKYAIASGWGKKTDNSSLANVLQWGRMQIMRNGQCARAWVDIKDSHICVSTAIGVSPCNGDSGGPLVLESSRVQVGLTSVGFPGGCTLGYPAVYTRITSYLYWIEENQ